MLNQNLKKFILKTVELDFLIAKGKEKSEEAKKICDELDSIWKEISHDEQILLTDFSLKIGNLREKYFPDT